MAVGRIFWFSSPCRFEPRCFRLFKINSSRIINYFWFSRIFNNIRIRFYQYTLSCKINDCFPGNYLLYNINNIISRIRKNFLKVYLLSRTFL